jgi:hypothetical protein
MVEIFLQYLTKEDIEAKLIGPYSPARFLFSNDNGENIVDSNLEFLDDVNKNHPLIWVQEKLDEIFNKLRKGQQNFNLGDKLISLTEPPYGLFQNYANMAILSFSFRKYVNELYDSTGKPRDARLLSDDVTEVFTAWASGNSSNKLTFRFGSKEELSLSKKLVAVFKLQDLKEYNDFSSLTDVRWGIGKYCQKKGYPLWTLKYANDNQNGLVEHINDIIKLCDDTTMNPLLVKAVLKGIEEYQYELLPLINSDKSFSVGFDNFLKNIEAVFLKEGEIKEVTEYVKSVLPGDLKYWTEDDVKNQVKNWRLIKNREITNPDTPTPIAGNNTANSGKDTSSSASTNRQDTKAQLSRTVKSLLPTKAKDILEKIIDECDDDEFLNIIKRYVD